APLVRVRGPPRHRARGSRREGGRPGHRGGHAEPPGRPARAGSGARMTLQHPIEPRTVEPVAGADTPAELLEHGRAHALWLSTTHARGTTAQHGGHENSATDWRPRGASRVVEAAPTG